MLLETDVNFCAPLLDEWLDDGELTFWEIYCLEMFTELDKTLGSTEPVVITHVENKFCNPFMNYLFFNNSVASYGRVKFSILGVGIIG